MVKDLELQIKAQQAELKRVENQRKRLEEQRRKVDRLAKLKLKTEKELKDLKKVKVPTLEKEIQRKRHQQRIKKAENALIKFGKLERQALSKTARVSKSVARSPFVKQSVKELTNFVFGKPKKSRVR